MAPPRFLVFGAGRVGGYLGGRLAAAGVPVRFVGRRWLGDAVRAHGLSLTDFRGGQWQVAAGDVRFDETLSAPCDAEVVLVTVKTAATPAAGRALANLLPPGALVVAFQNGLHNGEWLRELLPKQRVITGMVPFNIVHREPGALHQASGGVLAIDSEDGSERVQAAFALAGLPLRSYADMRGVLWAKLMLNLNNSINALCGLPLREELAQREFRRCLAAAQREALLPLAVAGVRLAYLSALPPQWMPSALALPDVLYRRLAALAPPIDESARSSMWDDLEAGHATEVEWINGEVIRLARAQGRAAPVNARLMQLVYEAEKGGERGWSGPALWAELVRARLESRATSVEGAGAGSEPASR